MNITELKTALRAHPELTVGLLLSGGDQVPAHFHITEVGHVARKLVDCGGTFRANEVCVLQAWVNSSKDDGHRISASRLAKIVEIANPILLSGDLPVEVEYEHGFVLQFPLMEAAVEGATLMLQLGSKHTDCLAREKYGVESSGVSGCAGGGSEAVCCAASDPDAADGRGCCS